MDTEVIVSDVPLDAKALGDPFARGALADAGKLHAFEIVLDAACTPISTAWRDNGFKGPMPSGLSSADVFVKSVLDGKVVAFSMGERLSQDTFVTHIEKAYYTVEGAYAMINREFALHNCDGFAYINREDDAGSEGLRKAKLSYNPAVLLEKDMAQFL